MENMDRMLLFAVSSVLAVSCWSLPQPINVVRMNQEIEDDIFKRDQPGPDEQVTFSLAKHFQDHMVLQQSPRRANIYGFSPNIGESVFAMLTIDGKNFHYKTTVEKGPVEGVGVWFITLDPIKTNSAGTIHVAAGVKTLSLHDVLFGDVWLCSGQSNMAFHLAWMTGGDEEIANAHKYPSIRIFDISKRKSDTPLYNLRSIDTDWSLPSNDTVHDFSALCWLYGKDIHIEKGYPIGLIGSDWGGTNIAAWSSPDSLAKCSLSNERDVGKPIVENVTMEIDGVHHHYTQIRTPHAEVDEVYDSNVLWNSMIHPLLGLTLYGVIWSQGEADTTPDRMDYYNCTFPALIEDWRLKFFKASKSETSPLFPFGFMQLGPEKDNPRITRFPGFPDVRWHQTEDIGYVPNKKMPNVFMAVVMDLTDFDSPFGAVHYRDKPDGGHRLALAGLAIAYQQQEFFQGPFPQKGSVESPGYLTIDYGTDSMLNVKTVNGFEVLCAVKDNTTTWIPALISSSNGTSITLYTGDCPTKYNAVRYAWEISPCPFKECAVYEIRNDLPGPPFIEYATKDSNGNVFFKFK